MTGTIIRTTGSWYTALTDEGRLFDCKVKGTFRLKGIRSTNPVAVGDIVTFSPGQDGLTGLIDGIEDRKNYIIRRASNLSKQSHIIAANVDQAALVVTIAHPETSTTFIDRFLASAEAYRVPVVIVFNKTDLYTDAEQERLRSLMALYQDIGYECLATSAQTGAGIDLLRQALLGKTTLLSGNSGVGKSTLLNILVPDAEARTAEISQAHDTGMHTTTFSQMFFGSISSPAAAGNASRNTLPLRGEKEAGFAIIDTPGIKGFGTFDMEREEVSHYFREIFQASSACRFGNCTHTHEPGCAVLRALSEGRIAESRIVSYLSMLDDKDENRYRDAT